jgi:putative ABC transport system permease protein
MLSAACVATAVAASVAERTREIGLRRAVGATRRAVQWQFIAEGVLLSTVGTMLGVNAGLVIGNLLAHSWLDLAPVLDIVLLLWIAGLSLGLGTVASIIPASRACAIDPITAVQHE